MSDTRALRGLSKSELIPLLIGEFSELSREGGLSWSEACVNYPPFMRKVQARERTKARVMDTDKHLLEIASDPKWRPGEFWAPWSYLDAIGFRYYFSAATLRPLLYSLEGLPPVHYTADVSTSGFTQSQMEAFAEFVLYQAELPTRNALLAVLNEADMSFEAYIASGEAWWTPDPVWTEWHEPLETWRKYLVRDQDGIK